VQSLEDADSFAAHLYGGRALVALQRPVEAGAEFRKALALQPDNPEALNDLAEVQLQAGEDAQAGEAFDRVLAAEPHNADGLAGKARVLLRAGDANAAASLLKELIAAAPNKPDTWLLEAWRLKAAGRGRRARLAMERAIALDTLFPPSWMEAAALFDGMGDASIAGLCRHKAMYLTGEDDTAERGKSEGVLRDVETESAELDELELQPEELAAAWSNRAAFYAALGELECALKYLDMIETEALARHRGSILLKLNNISGSRAAFERALELDPNSEQALLALQRLDAFSV
jgi:tetratricopeptide (TPR) repeat protein